MSRSIWNLNRRQERCPDSDGDGYSDADGSWTIGDGADAYPADPAKWSDFDGDGLSDQGGEDDCPNFAGTSVHDRRMP